MAAEATSSSALETLRLFDSGTIANAVDRLGLRPKITGYSSIELRCLFPELGTVVGYAVTCREDTTTPRDRDHGTFEDVYRACEASPQPTIIVCQDVSNDRPRSCHLGDIMSTVMRRLGVAGFVTDGGVRDVPGIRENAPGFHVFAAGTVPGAGESHVIDVGTPVSICGMEVHKGDLLLGDSNGLLAVPADSIEEIIAEAQKVRERESDLLAFISGEDFTIDSYFHGRR